MPPQQFAAAARTRLPVTSGYSYKYSNWESLGEDGEALVRCRISGSLQVSSTRLFDGKAIIPQLDTLRNGSQGVNTGNSEMSHRNWSEAKSPSRPSQGSRRSGSSGGLQEL